jgi:N-acetylglucosaminyldiphosphoundecaprenol N-acetyl-beta-D-mannosaminyltransferase
MRIKILGVNIDALTFNQALDKVAEFLSEPGGHAIFTPNPEMLVLAQNRPQFKIALNSAQLTIPDGVGLLWAVRFNQRRFPERVAGTDMVESICALAAKNGARVFFYGGRKDAAARAASKLKQKYPNLNIAGAFSDGKIEYITATSCQDLIPRLTKEAEDVITKTQPQILFVALGHPKQEEWIQAHLRKFPSVKVAMGIGGAFDFIAGDIKRAPVWLRKIHLEWFWRLILQPQRIGRILTAVILFPALVVGERLGIINCDD